MRVIRRAGEDSSLGGGVGRGRSDPPWLLRRVGIGLRGGRGSRGGLSTSTEILVVIYYSVNG